MKNKICGIIIILVYIGLAPLTGCNNTLDTLNVKFIAVSENAARETSIRYSTTGFYWPQSYVTPVSQTDQMNGAAYGDGNYIAVGAGNYTYQSTDGMTWGLTNLPAYAVYNDIAVGEYNGQSPATPYFVAVGAGGAVMYSSTHGKFWDSGTSGTTWNINGVASGSIAGQSVFVAVGDAPFPIPVGAEKMGTIIYSFTAGDTWIDHTYGGTSLDLYCVAYGGERFIAAGDQGVMRYSENLSVWFDTITTSNTEDIYGLACGTAHGGLVWVAVGANGTLLYSLDNGDTWSSTTYAPAAAWKSVIHRQSRFYAVGNNSADGMIIYSDDGVTWNTGATFPTADERFNDIACQ